MDLLKFKENMKDLIADTDYKIYLGSTAQYNTNRKADDNVLLIEPLKDFPLGLRDCKAKTKLNIWLMRKVENDYIDLDSEGINIEIETNLRDDAVTIYNLMVDSTFITPLDNIYNVLATYYDVTNSVIINNQVLLNLSLNCEIYDI